MSTLLIDDREDRANSKRLISWLKRLTNGDCECYHLPSGDFTFDGSGPSGTVTIGVERKNLSDLMGSIRSGRLSQQLQVMNQVFDFMYLIVEGIYRPEPNSLVLQENARGNWRDVKCGTQRFSYAELDHYLTTIELMDKVMVRKSAGEWETAIQVFNLWRWWSKDWDRHMSHEPVKSQEAVSLNRASFTRRAAAELDGIGWVRSKAVERAFGSVENMVNASLVRWSGLEIPVGEHGKKTQRLGTSRAKKIYQQLRGGK